MLYNRARAIGMPALAGLALAVAAQAGAATHFDFTFTGGLFSAAGSLTATDDGGGTFTATDGTMSVIGGPDAGDYVLYANASAPAVSTSPLGAFYYDDLLYPKADPILDIDGLLFVPKTGPANVEVNIYGNGPGQPYSYIAFDSSGYIPNAGSGDLGKFSMSDPGAVPEPFTATLCAAGLGLAFARRRRA